MKRALRVVLFLKIRGVEWMSHAVYNISGNVITVKARMRIALLWSRCHLDVFTSKTNKQEYTHKSYIIQNGAKVSLEHICHQVQLKSIWSKLQSVVKISTSLANCDWKNCSHFPIVIEYLSNLGLDCDNVNHILKQWRNPTATYKLGFDAN